MALDSVRVLAMTLLLVILGVDNGLAANLQDAKAQKTVVKCQKAIAQAGVKLTTSRLKGLHTCTLNALKCIQTSPDVGACLAKASAACNGTFRTAFPRAEATLAQKIVNACAVGSLRYADLLISDGLGLGTLAPECLADFQLDICSDQSLPTLATCLIKYHQRTSERLLGSALPRASDLLELLQLDQPPLYLPPLPGCGTCAQLPAKTIGKRVTACGTSIAKAGGMFAAKALATLEQCVNAVLTCQQNGNTPACFAQAQGACTKGAATLGGARAKLTAVLRKKCGDDPAGTLPFDVLRAASGLNIEALGRSCAAVGVPTLAGLDEYAACLQQQHECDIAAVVRSILPRSEEFAAAGLLGDAAPALDVSVCPTPSPAFASESARSQPSGSPRAVLFSITRFLKLVKTTGRPPATRVLTGAPRPTGFIRLIRILTGPRRVRPGFGNLVKIAYRGGDGASSAHAERAVVTAAEVAPPTLIVTVQRPDIETIDHFELTLDPVPPGAEGEVEIEVQYADQPPSCVFELAFASAEGESVSAYTALEQVVDPDASPEPTPTATSAIGTTATQTSGASPTGIATPTPTLTNPNTATPTSAVEPATPTSTSTPTPTAPASETATLTSTPTSAPTETATPTSTPSSTQTVTPAPTPTHTPSVQLLGVVQDGVDGADGLAGTGAIALSPDGKHAYATGYGDNGTVVTLVRDPATGVLSYLENDALPLNNAIGVAVDGTGANVYVAYEGSDAVATFSRNPVDGRLTFGSLKRNARCETGAIDATCAANADCDTIPGNGICVTNLLAPRAMRLSSDNKTLYLTALGSNSVVAFRRNPDGSLSFQQSVVDGVGGVDGLAAPTNLQLSPDDGSLYVAGGSDNAVAVFARDTATGTLTFIEAERGQPFPEIMRFPRDVAVSDDGASVYVVASNSGALSLFSRESIDGSLSFVEAYRHGLNGVGGLIGAFSVHVNSSYPLVHVEGYDCFPNCPRLSLFSRNPTDGRLRFVSSQEGGGSELVSGLASSSDGSLLYVPGGSAVASFRVDP